MPVLGAAAPTRAPGVELLGELAGSGYDESPSLVRRADGQTLQVTGLLYSLLELVDGRRDLPELAVALGERCGKTVAPEDVEYLLEHKLAPLGLLLDADGAAPQVKRAAPLLSLRFKVVVSDPAVTRRLTAPFAWLFRPWVVVPVLLAFVVTCWWVLREHGLAPATRQAFDSPGVLLSVFLLAVASAGWHEFGHAAACRAKGATPGAMGAGLYLVWPAFYTDVDDSYRLSRWGRLVVDLGGLYFNALAAVAVAGVWLAVRQDALLLVVAAQLLLMLRQLAPVVRADGYHVLADLTGVPDLFHHIRPTLAGLLPKNWGAPQPLRPWARWVVRAWVLVVVPLLLWMTLLGILLLPRLVATAWTGLHRQGAALLASAEDGNLLGVGAGVLRTVALVLPVLAVSNVLFRLVSRTSRTVWRRTEGSPSGRAAAVLGAAALLALLAWAWWPSGQYQPVRVDERGTLPGVAAVTEVRGRAETPALRALSAGPVRPIAGVRPQTAYALVPRSGDGPSVLLVRSADGSLRSILANGDRTGVAVPFDLPDPAGVGDNQAVAVNTKDGTVVYDVAVALVWVKDGQPATNRNEAYALASCRQCTTVAVAFQVVLVVGHSDAVAPVNVAVAGNRGCLRCVTRALAVQLVLTLREMPDEQVQGQLQAAMARLRGLEQRPDAYAEVQAVQRDVLALLVRSGLVDEQDAAAVDASPSASPSTGTGSAEPSPSGTAGAEPSADPTPSDGPTPYDEAPSGEPTEQPTEQPSATAQPSPYDDPTPQEQQPSAEPSHAPAEEQTAASAAPSPS